MSIQKIIASLKRKQIRKKTLNAILHSKQKDEGVINLHRIDKNNIGDYFCAPHHYFDSLKNSQLDIFDYKRTQKEITTNFIEKVTNNSLIIGGGGLLNRHGFHLQMKLFQKLSENGKKIVLWGVGHNEKSPKTYGKVTNYNIDISKFGLAGTRDFNMPGDYVPCVSCMHSVFNEKYVETDEIGVVFHKDTIGKKITEQFKHLPCTSNTTDLESLIQFIGKHETIITNSYHAMYWSMLLNKKVVVIPNSSKFYGFKYKPIFTSFENSLKDAKNAERQTGILEECRQLNIDFYNKTANFLNI